MYFVSLFKSFELSMDLEKKQFLRKKLRKITLPKDEFLYLDSSRSIFNTLLICSCPST